MRKFNDNKNRGWILEINVGAIKRVRDLAKIDLLDMENGRIFERLIDDPVALCDVIYVLVKIQADEKGITDEDFGQSMAGDAIEDATTAMLEELVDFFPGPRRAILKKALGKLRTVQKLMIETANKELDNPEMEQRIQREILGKLSTNSPESPESIPTD